MQPQIILIREGNDDSQGVNQIISNINACKIIQDIMKTTLGPFGMDKMIQTERDFTISNDGATIIELLNIEHPAARLLVDLAKSQDNEIGDGTTSVIVLTGELLNEAKTFIEENVNPYTIIVALRECSNFIKQVLPSLQIT